MDTQTLYRPVGIKELELIADSGWKAFPPRLEWQPFFYPVLNQAYAEQIAEQWNTKDVFSGNCGIVTSFDLNAKHFRAYPTENVGGVIHNELWVPAAELPEFNRNICGAIRVVNVFFGKEFVFPEHEAVHKELLKFKK